MEFAAMSRFPVLLVFAKAPKPEKAKTRLLEAVYFKKMLKTQRSKARTKTYPILVLILSSKLRVNTVYWFNKLVLSSYRLFQTQTVQLNYS